MGGMEWDEGGRFRREGTYVDLWVIYVGVWQKPREGRWEGRWRVRGKDGDEDRVQK